MNSNFADTLSRNGTPETRGSNQPLKILLSSSPTWKLKKRKFVLYRFSSDEDPVFVYKEDAPDYGDIMSVNKIYSDNSYRVKYTD